MKSLAERVDVGAEEERVEDSADRLVQEELDGRVAD